MPAAAALALETRTDAVVAVVDVLADEKPLHADDEDAPEEAEEFDDVDDVGAWPLPLRLMIIEAGSVQSYSSASSNPSFAVSWSGEIVSSILHICRGGEYGSIIKTDSHTNLRMERSRFR